MHRSRKSIASSLMVEALLLLLEKEEYDFISVKDICEKAGVNRSTFYSYYNTKDDLLVETMKLISKRLLSNFDDDTIKQMIILLFKTQEVGIINDVLDSINECMVHLQDTSIKNYIDKEEKKIEKFYMMPIILSAAAMLIISFYVFSLIGQGIYV